MGFLNKRKRLCVGISSRPYRSVRTAAQFRSLLITAHSTANKSRAPSPPSSPLDGCARSVWHRSQPTTQSSPHRPRAASSRQYVIGSPDEETLLVVADALATRWLLSRVRRQSSKMWANSHRLLGQGEAQGNGDSSTRMLRILERTVVP